jgi:hypothetical protein
LTISCSASILPAATNGPATATDNCATPTINYTDSVVNGIGNNKVITRTWTATDSNSNTATYSQTITVTDTTAPTFTTSPANLTISCSASILPAATNGPATATDNCATPTINYTDSVVNGIGNNKVITRTWTATDVNSNTSTYSQTITVTDTTAPTFTTSPANLTISCSDSSLPADTNGPATASDNCATPTVNYSDSVVNGTGNNKVITRTWTTTDDNSNTTTYSQTITVTDTTAPTISCPATITANTSNDGTGNCTTIVSLGTPTVLDNCATVANIIITAKVGGVTINPTTYLFGIGTTTVVWTATDQNGNVSLPCNQIVTITDNEKPLVTAPNTIALQCLGELPLAATTISAFNSLAGASATDNCTATSGLTVSSSTIITTPGNCNGVITRTYIITDANSNSQSVNHVFTINDTTKPIVVAPTTVDLECSGDLPAAVTTIAAFNTLLGAAASDNCTPTVNLIVTSTTGALVGDAYSGSITRTYTITDNCGNKTNVNQLFTISDDTNPIAKCKNVSVTLNTSGFATITVNQIDNGSTDNCGIFSIEASRLVFNCGNIGNNTVVLTVKDNNGNTNSCNATVIVIDPAATATVSILAAPSTPICQGSSITFSATTANAGINPHFQWYKNGVPVGTDSTTYTDTSLTNGETIYVTLSSGPCNSFKTSNTITATVNPLPTVTAPTKICVTATANLSPTTGGTWTSSNTVIATVTNGGVITAKAPGTVTFTYTNSSTGCSKTTSVVTVYALPVVTAPAELCINATKVLSPTSGGVWTSSNPSVATVNNAGVITGVSVGNASFTFMNTVSGCSSTTPSVTIKALPVIVSATATPATVCSGDQSSLDVIAQGAASTATTIVNYNFNSGTSYANLVSNAVTGITSVISSTNLSFNTNNTGVATTPAAFTNNATAGDYLIADRKNRSWVFTLGGTDLPNYTSFNIYFQAQRQNSGTTGTKRIEVLFRKNGGASVSAGTVVQMTNGNWMVASFTLPSGASNPNSLEITLNISGNGSDNNDIRIDNFQVQGIKSGTTYLYSWTASPAATAGLPANAGVPSATNKNIPVSPTVTTNYTAIVTNSDGCQATKIVRVNVYPDPQLKITADYCYGPNQVRLLASATGPIGNFVWSTGETGSSILVDTAQIVEVVGTTPNGCTYVATLSVAQELVTNGDFTNFNPSAPSFTTEYRQHQAFYLTGDATSGLWPEGDYAVNTSAFSPSNGVGYHPNFHGQDHTNNSVGPRNFLMVNGSTTTIPDPPGPDRQRIIWQQTVTVTPNTDYYFSAYAMNLNPVSPARLQFEVNGVLVGSIADLTTAPKPTTEAEVNLSNWIRFYSTPTWNSGSATTAVIRIRNLNTIAGGNDFALDDISFGTLSPFLILSSGPGTDTQTLCKDTPLTEITYSVGSGNTAPNVTGLPAGVTSSFNGYTLKFVGTPTVGQGTYPYTIVTTGTCGNLTAHGSITVNPAATVNAGSDITTCSSTPTVTMAASIGGSATGGTWSGGSGSFNNNSINAIYTLGASDSGTITLTYTTNDPDGAGPCPAVSDTVNIIITPIFVADAGNVTTTANCADTTVNLAANGTVGLWTVTSGQDAGSFSFSNTTSPTSTFTGESGQTYTLTWTIKNASPCPDTSDTVTFTIANCLNIYFDGVDDNVNFGNNFNATAAFSFEIWVKPNSINGFSKSIFSKQDANNKTTGYDLRIESNSISFYVNNTKVVTRSGITIDRWYHVVVTFDGSNYKLYYDGIEMDSKTGPSPTTNNSNFLVGALYKSGSKPVNYFNGSLDELRIWKVCLTKEQIRQMMNQEIVMNATAVYGAIVPLQINGLTWSNLAGYYQMNQNTPDVVAGTLNETGFVSGRLLNMTLSQAETAPLPYTTGVHNQEWTTDNTWTQHQVWDCPNSLGVNGDPIEWNIVKSTHNILSGNKNITLLGLIVDSGKITVADSSQALDEKNNGIGLWITHYLKLNGVIDLVGESQLVQKQYTPSQSSESILDETSTGYIERDQQGKRNSFNYNYWSSPVSIQGGANNAPYSIEAVLKDGTISSTPKTISFGSGAYFADSAISNPIKISNRWIWTYNSIIVGGDELSNYYQWNNVAQTGLLRVGEGYTMKGTGGTAPITTTQNYVFVGKPNNGTISLNLNKDSSYLVGNPYSSALDANEFIKDNLATRNAQGKNVFNGALYFWDHFANSNNHLLAEYQGGYATYSLIGGVVGINDSELTLNDGSNGSNRPKQFIPIGQGFFVDSYLDPAVSGTGIPTSVDGGTLIFKNSQRTFVRENAVSSVFMKKKETAKTTLETIAKIRLGFDSALGAHRQLLVGADPNTTDGFDIGYDAPMYDSNENDMFWNLNNSQFVIQGVPDFNANRIIPLGLAVANEGEITIKLDELENVSTNTEIYLFDSQTTQYHDLKNKDYKTVLAVGKYDNRFSLRFTNQTLGVEEVEEVNDGIIALYSNNYNTLIIRNNLIDTTVNLVTLFNLAGQKISHWDVKGREQKSIQIPIKNLPSEIYIVKINTTKGEFSKKIIVK